MMRRVTVVAVTAALFITVVAAAAMAASPLFVDRFVDTFTDEDPGLAAECGLETVHVDGLIRGVFKEYEDGHIQETVVGNLEFIGPGGEGPVYVTFANPHQGRLVSEVFDPATGLVTVVFEDTFWGNPEKWRIPGVGVIVSDTGYASFTTTLVIDTSTDGIVSEETSDLVLHGPHPRLENGFAFTSEEREAICGALGA